MTLFKQHQTRESFSMVLQLQLW